MGILLVTRFLGRAGFTSMSKVSPADPTVELSRVLIWLVIFDNNVFSCASMTFIVTVVCANCAMTSELELVRTVFSFASPSYL